MKRTYSQVAAALLSGALFLPSLCAAGSAELMPRDTIMYTNLERPALQVESWLQGPLWTYVLPEVLKATDDMSSVVELAFIKKRVRDVLESEAAQKLLDGSLSIGFAVDPSLRSLLAEPVKDDNKIADALLSSVIGISKSKASIADIAKLLSQFGEMPIAEQTETTMKIDLSSEVVDEDTSLHVSLYIHRDDDALRLGFSEDALLRSKKIGTKSLETSNLYTDAMEVLKLKENTDSSFVNFEQLHDLLAILQQLAETDEDLDSVEAFTEVSALLHHFKYAAASTKLELDGDVDSTCVVQLADGGIESLNLQEDKSSFGSSYTNSDASFRYWTNNLTSHALQVLVEDVVEGDRESFDAELQSVLGITTDTLVNAWGPQLRVEFDMRDVDFAAGKRVPTILFEIDNRDASAAYKVLDKIVTKIAQEDEAFTPNIRQLREKNVNLSWDAINAATGGVFNVSFDPTRTRITLANSLLDLQEMYLADGILEDNDREHFVLRPPHFADFYATNKEFVTHQLNLDENKLAYMRIFSNWLRTFPEIILDSYAYEDRELLKVNFQVERELSVLEQLPSVQEDTLEMTVDEEK